MTTAQRVGMGLLGAALGLAVASSCTTNDCDVSTCESDCRESYDKDDVQLAACYDHCATCGTETPDEE